MFHHTKISVSQLSSACRCGRWAKTGKVFFVYDVYVFFIGFRFSLVVACCVVSVQIFPRRRIYTVPGQVPVNSIQYKYFNIYYYHTIPVLLVFVHIHHTTWQTSAGKDPVMTSNQHPAALRQLERNLLPLDVKYYSMVILSPLECIMLKPVGMVRLGHSF